MFRHTAEGSHLGESWQKGNTSIHFQHSGHRYFDAKEHGRGRTAQQDAQGQSKQFSLRQARQSVRVCSDAQCWEPHNGQPGVRVGDEYDGRTVFRIWWGQCAHKIILGSIEKRQVLPIIHCTDDGRAWHVGLN
jgi:hypothetical protein